MIQMLHDFMVKRAVATFSLYQRMVAMEVGAEEVCEYQLP